MLILKLLLPVTFVAVMVYIDKKDCEVGVPEITPVEVLNDNPAGKDGLIAQVVTAPPVLVGVKVDIAVPTVYVFDAGL
jgi:hypothetical protein